MPSPKPKESKNDFMARCIPQVMEEGKDQDQAVAMCSGLYAGGWKRKK